MPHRRRNGGAEQCARIMTAISTTLSVLGIAVALALCAPAAGAGFVDVLDTPAQMSPLASRSLLQEVTKAGDRLVAVGQRGHVLVSTDGGATWKQSTGSGELGPDGGVLRRRQGRLGRGARWRRPAHRRRRRTLGAAARRAARPTSCCVAAMERKVAADPASESAKTLLDEAKRYKEQGPDKPFLDVWFADAQERLRGRRVQPDLSHHRRRQDVGAVVRPDRQSQILQPVRDRRVRRRPLYRGRGGRRPEARRCRAALQGADPGYSGSFFGVADAGVCRARLRTARQRLPQRRTAARVDEDRRRTAGIGRRARPRRATGRCCSPTSAGASLASIDGGQSFAAIALEAADAAHRRRRRRRRELRAGGSARCRACPKRWPR